MKNKIEVTGIAALMLVLLGCLFFGVVVWLFELLYNYVVPGIFNAGPHLGFWQAFAVYLLISIVFGRLRIGRKKD